MALKKSDLYVITSIDELFLHVRSPMRTRKQQFVAYRLEELDSKTYKDPMGSLRNLFYTVSIIYNGCFQYIVNNNAPRDTLPFTVVLLSPFHIYRFYSKQPPQGFSISFSESFVHAAFSQTEFQQEFPFFWSNENIFHLQQENAVILQDLGEKIILEYEHNRLFSENIIRDYVHIFLLEIGRIISRTALIIDNSLEYNLLQQFFWLVNNKYPLVKTVEHVAGLLSVTPAHLWLAVKRLTGQTPSQIINQRILVEAQSLLRQSGMTVSEIAYHLDFKEKSHFTRFFKNLTGLTPLEYSKQSRLQK